MRVLRGVLVAALVPALLLFGAPPTATSAADDVEFRAETTYSLRPTLGRLDVAIDGAVTNVTPSRGRIRYFYTGYRLAIERQARSVSATSDERRLEVTTRKRKGYTEVSVEFGSRIFLGETFRFRVRYQLPGAKPRTSGRTRVGRAYAAFYAYAQGEESASVRIVIPRGFALDVEGSSLERRTAPDGSSVLQAVRIRKPATWWAWVSADRRPALRVDRLHVPLGGRRARVHVHSWPEDSLWRRNVTRALRDGLPVLHRLVGLDWPLDETLEVVEIHAPLLAGYYGIYDEHRTQILLSEEVHAHVTLHEASHAWFSPSLFSQRWIVEGLADSYTTLTLAELGRPVVRRPSVRPGAQGAFPLNEWPKLGRVETQRDEEREMYGYNASWTVTDALIDEIGVLGMRVVIDAAAAKETPYIGRLPAETLRGTADWRRYLDLLEERGGSKRATGLFQRWVVRGHDRERLRQRRIARGAYASLRSAADDWTIPFLIRYRLSIWDFTRARQLMDDARGVLERRDRIEDLASSLGIAVSPALEREFEGAKAGFRRARSRADEQLATLEQIERASRALGTERDPVVALGLWGETPETTLDEAGDRFAANDLRAARARATEALSLVETARTRGTDRLVIGAGAAAASTLLVGGGIVWGTRRRRRRTRREAAVASSAGEDRPSRWRPPSDRGRRGSDRAS